MLVKWIFFILSFSTLNFNYIDTNPSPPLWWTIDIYISAEGKYQYPDNQQGISGVYDFQLKWQGAMERDNGDYLIYQGEDSLVSLKWSESQNNKIFDLCQTIKPKSKLNYVVRKKNSIHFDFEIFSFITARGNASFEIILPCSAENGLINPQKKYNRGVVTGSNEIYVSEKHLYQEKRIFEKFQWEWKRKGKSHNQDHTVVLEIIITQNKK
jgi:hypothetical protein